MGHPFPEGTGQDEKRARYDRAAKTRRAMREAMANAFADPTGASINALVEAIEDHAHAVADRVRDGIEMDDGTTL